MASPPRHHGPLDQPPRRPFGRSAELQEPQKPLLQEAHGSALGSRHGQKTVEIEPPPPLPRFLSAAKCAQPAHSVYPIKSPVHLSTHLFLSNCNLSIHASNPSGLVPKHPEADYIQTTHKDTRRRPEGGWGFERQLPTFMGNAKELQVPSDTETAFRVVWGLHSAEVSSRTCWVKFCSALDAPRPVSADIYAAHLLPR